MSRDMEHAQSAGYLVVRNDLQAIYRRSDDGFVIQLPARVCGGLCVFDVTPVRDRAGFSDMAVAA